MENKSHDDLVTLCREQRIIIDTLTREKLAAEARAAQLADLLVVSEAAAMDKDASSMTDQQIVAVWQAMPGGPDGWLKSFGFLQFARAVLDAAPLHPLPAEQGAAPQHAEYSEMTLGELLERYWNIAFSEGQDGVSRGSEAQAVLSAIMAAPQQQAQAAERTLICLKCNTDRLKKPCPRSVHECPMIGHAQAAQSETNAALDRADAEDAARFDDVRDQADHDAIFRVGAYAIRQPTPIDRAAIHRKVMDRDIDGPDVVGPTVCTIPPAGWYCTRAPGHDGPCAAYPVAPVAATAQGEALTVAVDAKSDPTSIYIVVHLHRDDVVHVLYSDRHPQGKESACATRITAQPPADAAQGEALSQPAAAGIAGAVAQHSGPEDTDWAYQQGRAAGLEEAAKVCDQLDAEVDKYPAHCAADIRAINKGG